MRIGLSGHRPKTLTTAAGDMNLRIPKLRAGSFSPSLLERRRRIDPDIRRCSTWSA
jgi:putative transposase